MSLLVLITLLLYQIRKLCFAQFFFDSEIPRRGREKFVIIETSLGRVMGRNVGAVNEFLGIPYAEPPIGKLRFRPTRPKRHWQSKLYNATQFSPECLQSTLFAGESDNRPNDEDCLYLNIWQPVNIARKNTKENSSKYPVLIWIYGGAFVHGGSSLPEYYGNKLAARGVVVVSFNYRLGALGFLVSTADGLFGNYGLDDQKTAIQWVHDNIASFGGDPDRVTLCGESAGAMSIGLHVLDQQYRMDTPISDVGENIIFPKKLFHAAILQSNPMGYKYRSIAISNFIGSSFRDQLDCEDLRCLQSESAEEILHVQDTMVAVPRSIGDFFAWGPVVTDQAYFREVKYRSGYASNITVRQPMEVVKEMRRSRRLDIPIIIGTTADEGTVFVFTAFPTRMNKFIYQLLVFSFFRTSALAVMRMYGSLAQRVSDSHDPDYRPVLSRIIGDYLFRCPSQYFAEQLSTLGTAVFLYEFSLPTRTPGFPCCDGLSCHTCELPYVFNQVEVIEADYSWSEDIFRRNSDGEKQSDGDLPDIFGASSNRRESCSASFHATAGTANNSNSSRNQDKDKRGASERATVDEHVSRFMADYWTTFSTHGDPNGASGSSWTNELYWPRLLGDLSPHPPKARSEDAILRAARENGVRTERESSTDEVVIVENAVGEVYEVAPTDHRRPTLDGTDDNGNDDDNDDENNDVVLDEELMRMTSGDEELANRLSNHRGRFARVMNGDFYEVYDSHASQHQRTEYSKQSTARTSRSNRPNRGVRVDRDRPMEWAKPGRIFDRFRNNKETASRINMLMHQMVFDEEIHVDIFSNECICNAWNRLEYVF